MGGALVGGGHGMIQAGLAVHGTLISMERDVTRELEKLIHLWA